MKRFGFTVSTFCVLLAMVLVATAQEIRLDRNNKMIEDPERPERVVIPVIIPVQPLPTATPTPTPAPTATPLPTPEVPAVPAASTMPQFEMICDPSQGPCIRFVRPANTPGPSCLEFTNAARSLTLGTICVRGAEDWFNPNGIDIFGQNINLRSNRHIIFEIPIGYSMAFGGRSVSADLAPSSERPQYIFEADGIPPRKIIAMFRGGKYIQFTQQLVGGATRPPDADCTKREDVGLRVLDVAGEKEWICLGEKGWRWHPLLP